MTERLAKYGLNEAIYAAMLAVQDGACDICRQSFATTPHIDHDHMHCPGGGSCGLCVRGLLCGACNYLVGVFQHEGHGGVPEGALFLAYADSLPPDFRRWSKWAPQDLKKRRELYTQLQARVPTAAISAYLDRWANVRSGRFDEIVTLEQIGRRRERVTRLVPRA